MKTHRQGRTGATTVASRETPVRRLLATLRKICRQLVRLHPDAAVRRAGREVERELTALARRRPDRRGGK